ncbi:MAG: hypothetical protein GY866_13990 [Proteobacteria bacterium]|nr:hypothetical protein [Pseudomonadota bacterium]
MPNQGYSFSSRALPLKGDIPETPKTFSGRKFPPCEAFRSPKNSIEEYTNCLKSQGVDSVFSLENHDFMLMLEDVAHLRMGEWYVSQPEDSRLMLNKLAPFHARWWMHPDLEKLDWIPQPGPEDFAESMDQLKQIFSGVLPHVKGQYETNMSANAWATLEWSFFKPIIAIWNGPAQTKAVRIPRGAELSAPTKQR